MNKEHKNLSTHLQSAREEERKLLAGKLHDTIGQALTVLKMDLFILKKFLPQDQEKIFEKIQSMDLLLDHTIQGLRKIYSDLRPTLIEFLGLESAIENHLDQFQDQAGIKSDFETKTDGIELEKSQSLALFRILQEALNNVRWHSQATHVSVDLVKNSSHVNLVIKDNGVGIHTEKLTDPLSFGLIGMKERADFLLGKLLIKGIQKKGTTVKLSFPLSLK